MPPAVFRQPLLIDRESGKDRIVDQANTQDQADSDQAFAGEEAEMISTVDRAPFPVRLRVILLLAILSWLVLALFVAIVIRSF